MLISSLLHLYRLRRNQWLERESLQRLQRKKLWKMIVHAYKNVGYYHKLFDSAGIRPDDIRSEEDLVKIPITTRSQLQSLSPEEIVAQDVNPSDCIRLRTAGSSGKPLTVFFRQKEKDYHDMVWARTSLETGRTLWDRTASFKSGSSGFCVGAIQFPPLCKGRHGGVEASRGWASPEVLGSCKPARFLPPLAPPYKGGDSLGNHPCPSTHPHDFRKSLKSYLPPSYWFESIGVWRRTCGEMLVNNAG